MARDGRDAERGRLGRLAPRRARRRPRRPRNRGCTGAARERGPALRAVPRRRADAPPRPRRARRLRRSLRPTRPRRALAGDAGRRRLRAARLARAAPRPRRPAGERPGFGRRRAERALAPDPRLGARPAARDDRVGGGICVRRRAPRRGSRRRLLQRRRRRCTLRPAAASNRAGVGLRARLSALPPALPNPQTPGGALTDLTGKTAVITGASRGIGAAVAHMLHDRGCNLGLAARSGSDLGLERVVAQACDVRDLEALTELCDATAERFGGIHIVVPNAGVGAYGPFLCLSREHLDEMLGVNLKGTVYAIRAALPHMLGREGDVVSLASEAGRRGLPYEAVYCASKFGQVGFTRALDHELREHNIRCTNVCPGGVATDFALEEGRGRTRDALVGMMSAENVAEVVLFVVTRKRNHRILETALRPMTEASWG